jgi:hypothetical protein
MARVNSFVVVNCTRQTRRDVQTSGWCTRIIDVLARRREFLARSRELQPNIGDITSSDFILDPQDLMSESWPLRHLSIGISLCEFSSLLCLAVELTCSEVPNPDLY